MSEELNSKTGQTSQLYETYTLPDKSLYYCNGKELPNVMLEIAREMKCLIEYSRTGVGIRYHKVAIMSFAWFTDIELLNKLMTEFDTVWLMVNWESAYYINYGNGNNGKMTSRHKTGKLYTNINSEFRHKSIENMENEKRLQQILINGLNRRMNKRWITPPGLQIKPISAMSKSCNHKYMDHNAPKNHDKCISSWVNGQSTICHNNGNLMAGKVNHKKTFWFGFLEIKHKFGMSLHHFSIGSGSSNCSYFSKTSNNENFQINKVTPRTNKLDFDAYDRALVSLSEELFTSVHL